MRKYYDTYAPRYDVDYNKPYWHLYDDITWHFLEPYLPDDPAATILDVGGGTAKWAVKLAEMGYSVICGDISEGMLQVARQKVRSLGFGDQISVVNLDIRDLYEYPDNTFPLVLALGDVLSYAIDDELAVAEMLPRLHSRGACVASVDNKLTYIINEINYDHFDRIQPFLETGISHFLKMYSLKAYYPSEIRNLFERHGFAVDKVVGKPVLANLISKKRRDERLVPHYQEFLSLEIKLAGDDAFAGHGGHLQIMTHKPVKDK